MNNEKVSCYHCGEPCVDEKIQQDEYTFCCNGCAQVYTILKDNNLGDYYNFEAREGYSQKSKKNQYYEYLDNDEIQERLISLRTDNTNTIVISLPQIHCSACIWILERLHKFDVAIISSRVNFLKKECTITYKSDEIKLSELANLLDSIGYTPTFSLNDAELNDQINDYDKKLLYKIGVAGFCFGNIMLISFPEYLSNEYSYLYTFFDYLKILLVLPVIFYAGYDYIIAGWLFIKRRVVGIDLPIAIGMTALFVSSIYEILSGSGEGYLDSLAGFVFMLLLGKWFQNRTYSNISFDLDYKSFFPISISKKVGQNWSPTLIEKLTKDDIILIRTHEIIPCDSQILKGDAQIDYSFVTGESDPITTNVGQVVYAGGKVQKGFIEASVLKSTNQSRLTKLWNESTFQKEEEATEKTIIDLIGKYFVYGIIVIAMLGLAYWIFRDSDKAFNVFTSVLIIACPCVLALSIPFIYGNALRHLSHQGIYLKNTYTLFRIQDVDTIVFDKTGTLTDQNKIQIDYKGERLDNYQKSLIYSLTSYSSHPKSKAISNFLGKQYLKKCTEFEEVIGKGIKGIIDNHLVRIGSANFIKSINPTQLSVTYVEIDNQFIGEFVFMHELRDGIHTLLSELRKDFQLHLLSGDSQIDDNIKVLFQENEKCLANQTPQDKLAFIEREKAKGAKIMMIGDGLNDSGALKSSHVGVVLTNSNNQFTPAADVVLEGEKVKYIRNIINHINSYKTLLYISFAFAILYNGIGLYFALRGELTPIFAAILMPISSLTIVIFGFLSSNILANKFIKQFK